MTWNESFAVKDIRKMIDHLAAAQQNLSDLLDRVKKIKEWDANEQAGDQQLQAKEVVDLRVNLKACNFTPEARKHLEDHFRAVWGAVDKAKMGLGEWGE